TESFAAAGSLVVLLAWVYYAAQIFLLGAEFTKVYADEHGSKSGAKPMKRTEKTADAGMPVEVTKGNPAAAGASAEASASAGRAAAPAVGGATSPAVLRAVPVSGVSVKPEVVQKKLQAAKKELLSTCLSLLVVSLADAAVSQRKKKLEKRISHFRWRPARTSRRK
ncbi:MAG: hypothetical protein M3150_07945, partial [Pseudomonadota bacterium]|nr:hypothetical protein [Pseudomonadota bacterium]